MFGLGLLPEPAQRVGGAGGVLGRHARPLRGRLLRPPVDVVHQAALGHVPGPQARHVRRGDVHEVGPGATVPDGPQQFLDTAEVGGETRVDRRVEGHLTRAVDHDVEIRRQRRHPLQVAFEHRDPFAQRPLDPVRADTLAPCGKSRFGHETGEPGVSTPAGAGTDEDDHVGVGQIGQ